MGTFSINLDDVRLFGRHGIFESERQNGNEFIVDLSLSYDAPPQNVINEDELDNTICYASLFEIIKEEMANPRNLLETVCSSIVFRIHDRFPQAFDINCRITKAVPPIPDFNGRASVAFSM